MNFWPFSLFLLSIGIVIINCKKDRILKSFPDFFNALQNNRIASIADLDNHNEINSAYVNPFLCNKAHSSDYYFPTDDESSVNDEINYDFEDPDRRNNLPISMMENEIFSRNNEKRGNTVNGCDCQIKNDVIDLGYSHFPRYLFNAVCQDGIGEKSSHSKRCWRGSSCKPVEYKVRVLTYRTRSQATDLMEKDHSSPLLPDALRNDWKFKTITVAAGCFCSF